MAMRTTSLVGAAGSARVLRVFPNGFAMPFVSTRRHCRGFTVLELAAVMAVTLIVGAVGYSAGRTLSVRSQIHQGVRAARAVQEDVVRAFRDSGEVPASAAELRGRPAVAGGVLASISVDDGRIDLVYGPRADSAIAGRRLSLTPYEVATGAIVWLCGNEIPEPGEHPLGFTGGGRQAQQIPTTVEARFLPAACR
jgi:prepilin-type N-terminal cleavage/methylation domain-containing protein